MAWIKIPPEHHPIFRAALPDDRRVSTVNMFGGVAAKVNGRMFTGLFARSIMVKLGDADRAEALALDGAAPFDPMENGRVMGDSVLLPDDVMDDPAEMRAWMRRAFDHAITLPAKPAPRRPAKPATAARKAAGKGTAKPARKAKAAAKPARKPTRRK